MNFKLNTHKITNMLQSMTKEYYLAFFYGLVVINRCSINFYSYCKNPGIKAINIFS